MHADNWCGCFASQCGIEPWTSSVLWPDLGCLWWLVLWLLNCSSQFCNILKGESYALSASDCVAKLSVTDTISQAACTNEVPLLLNAWGHAPFECPLSLFQWILAYQRGHADCTWMKERNIPVYISFKRVSTISLLSDLMLAGGPFSLLGTR